MFAFELYKSIVTPSFFYTRDTSYDATTHVLAFSVPRHKSQTLIQISNHKQCNSNCWLHAKHNNPSQTFLTRDLTLTICIKFQKNFLT